MNIDDIVVLECPNDSWLNNRQVAIREIQEHRVLVEDQTGSYWVWLDAYKMRTP